ncbi:MAG: triose-phosphate isomerase [Peptococcaceae bacterium]|jgi:triosephosphate isomerase|nr:triose-phosphate isomerase [Peptococcaceae bacterium]
MARKTVIAGNWKMNKTAAQASAYAAEFLTALGQAPLTEVVLCAPFTALPSLQAGLAGSDVRCGAQNVFWASAGAYTGEISAEMLVDAGCTYVIIGHSERREILGESDELVARKLKAALSAGLIPILCVGENLAQRETGQAVAVVNAQMRANLAPLDAVEIQRLVVAYEPIWAIGTGKTASVADAQEMCVAIRACLAEIVPAAAAEHIPILYGGSVKTENIAAFMRQQDIDGALVGGASLDPADFAALVRRSGGEAN